MNLDPAPATRRLPLLTAFVVALALTLAAWPGSPDTPSHGAPGSAISAISASGADAPASTDDATAHATGDATLLAELAGRPVALSPRLAPELAAANPDKAIAKLEQKKAKKEARIAKQEAKQADAAAAIATLQDELALAEQALADALAMPSDTPEQIKAREQAIKAAEKAIAKLLKQIGRFEKKVDKLEDKIAAVEDQIDAIDEKIDAIADGLPGTLPGIGAEGLAGLRLPERMEVVTADDGAPTESPFAAEGDATAGFPPEADYFIDPQNTYIHDRSMEALQQVNSILCQLRQTAYDELVNLGPYNAQIDRSLCEDGAQGESGNGGVSADESEELEMWVVDSRRTTEGDHHGVGVWVIEDGGHPDDGGGGGGGDGGDGGGPKGPQYEDGSTIRVLIDIEEGESEDHPFGVFDLDFALVPPGGTADDIYFWGTLETAEATEGHMGFTFYQEEGDEKDDASWYQRNQVHVNMFTDASQGVARVKEYFRDPFGGGPGGESGVEDEVEYLIAFDDQHLLRHEVGGDEVCLSRTQFDTSVWRYNLYHASGSQAGERVKLQSGFGFKTADGEFGWAGYHGLWYPDHVTLQSGDVVYGNSYGPPGGDPPPAYEVYVAPGKLWEYTRSALDLAELDGETFEWWSFGGPPGTPPAVFLLQYDHLTGDFTAIESQVEGSWEFEPLQPEDQFAVDRQFYPWLNLWSPSLGGNLEHLDGDDFVTYFTERVVDGNHPLLAGGDAQLFGLLDCLDTGILGSEAELGDVYLPDAFDVGDPHVYQFSAQDLGLRLDTYSDGTSFADVGLAPGETYSSGPFDWGMRSGPMVTSLDGITNPWDLFHAEVTYVYETGPNRWNHYETLIDDVGGMVSFDPPIQFTYVHSQSNDRNGDATFAGKTHQFEYNGPGDLWGIPHDGFDTDGDGFQDRWYPRFSIADGVLLGPTGTEYVIKALEMEQRLSEHPDGCGALTTDPVASLPLPTGSTWGFPDIGDKPVVTDPPLVIAGEVQTGDG